MLRVLGNLGMRSDGEPAPTTRLVDTTSWVRARRSGLFRLSTDLGVRVAKADDWGVADAHGQSRGTVRAPFDGIVIGLTRNPQVSQGDALVHVADLGVAARRHGVTRDPVH